MVRSCGWLAALLIAGSATRCHSVAAENDLAHAAARAGSQVPLDSVDLAVFAAALTDARVRHEEQRELLIQTEVEGVPSWEQPFDVWRDQLPGLQDETVSSFHRRSGMPALLTPTLPLPFAYRLVSRAEWTKGPRSSSVYIVSRPGYNRDRSQALMYVVEACPLCGQTSYLLLVRGPNGWTVSAQAVTANS